MRESLLTITYILYGISFLFLTGAMIFSMRTGVLNLRSMRRYNRQYMELLEETAKLRQQQEDEPKTL
jgi:hypothetical protein